MVVSEVVLYVISSRRTFGWNVSSKVRLKCSGVRFDWLMITVETGCARAL